jgi:hypothetical protein
MLRYADRSVERMRLPRRRIEKVMRPKGELNYLAAHNRTLIWEDNYVSSGTIEFG